MLVNSLSALVLDSFNVIGSKVYFNWLQQYHNSIVVDPGFFTVYTSPRIENVISILFWIFGPCLSIIAILMFNNKDLYTMTLYSYDVFSADESLDKANVI